jgi:calcium-dependent protein kinase
MSVRHGSTPLQHLHKTNYAPAARTLPQPGADDALKRVTGLLKSPQAAKQLAAGLRPFASKATAQDGIKKTSEKGSIPFSQTAFDKAFDLKAGGDPASLFMSYLEYVHKEEAPRNRLDRFYLVDHQDGTVQSQYDLSEKLGAGAFGVVYRAKPKSGAEPRVAKAISKSATGVNLMEIYAEIEVLRALDHPQVVRLTEYFEDRETLYIIMELVDGIELQELVTAAHDSGTGVITEKWVSAAMSQVVNAVSYCHSNRVIHRDLKMANVMVRHCKIDDAKKGKIPQHPIIVVVDFGFAEILATPEDRGKEGKGSPIFAAPELFKQNYGPKVDVWSMGVMTFVLLSGTFPFPATEMQELINLLLGPSQPNWNLLQHCSAQAVDVCKKMLTKDENRRVSAQLASEHPWFRTTSHAALPVSSYKHLAEFHRKDFFLRSVENVLATRISTGSANVEAVAETFLQLDANKDGVLTVDELKAGLEKMGILDADEIIATLDVSGDLVVSYTEFLAACVSRSSSELRRDLWEVFQIFDEDKDGALEVSELADFLSGDHELLGAQRMADGTSIDEVMNSLDRDHDGKVTWEEFSSYCLQKLGVNEQTV